MPLSKPMTRGDTGTEPNREKIIEKAGDEVGKRTNNKILKLYWVNQIGRFWRWRINWLRSGPNKPNKPK